MKKLVALMVFGFVGAIAMAPVAFAGSDHHEVVDGCDHGATGKPCKDDPSSNGKDCEVHGNHGGVNEDHCDTETTEGPTTTTTAPAEGDDDDETTTTTIPVVVDETTTSTTAPAVVVVPTTVVPVVRTVPVDETPVPAPVAEVAVPEAPHATCVDSGGFVYHTAPGPCPVPALIVDHTVAPVAAPLGELPHTGSGTGFIGMVGFILVLFGAGIQLIFRPLLKA